MSLKRPLRSAFLVTVSTLALSACQSEGGAPPSAAPPHGNPPAQDPPAPNPPAQDPPAPNPPAPGSPSRGAEIHSNPPPPPSEVSYPLNPTVNGTYLVTDGATCTLRGQHDPKPCPDLMKDPAWKKCTYETMFMKGDASSCYCEHHGNPPLIEPVACPAVKPSPWPPHS